MSKIRILTDSASDISERHEKKYNIKVVPFKIAMGDKSYVSRVDFSNDKFYSMMEAYDGLPLTSQFTAFEFQEVFEEMYKDGVTDVIFTNNISMTRDKNQVQILSDHIY